MFPSLPFPFTHLSFFQPIMEVKMIRWEVEKESSEGYGEGSGGGSKHFESKNWFKAL
jgi:hypothetical protein